MGFDFADPERGLFGTCRPSGAAIVFDHDDVLAASGDAAPRQSDSGGDAGVALELDGAALELELSRLGTPLALRGERSGAEELAVCNVRGELSAGGGSRSISCLGIRSDAVSDPEPEDVSLTRAIAIAFADGGILALRGARPRGAAEHDEEEVTVLVADADGETTLIREPLLSTHYDGHGRQLRATLELWPEGDGEPRPPLRVGGAIVCGTTLPLGERRLDLAFFRWSLDGRPGLGRYEILSDGSG
jgi:hypothetical protein